MRMTGTRTAITAFMILTGLSSATLLPLKAETPKTIEISVTDEKLLFNGKEFALAPSRDQLATIWGQPDRVKNLANDIRIWDSLGVRTYSKPGSINTDSISFTMKEQDFALAAKKVFSGKITLPKGVITSHSTVADLQKLGFTQDSTLDKFYRFELLSGSFLAEVDTSSGALISLSLECGLGF